MRESKEESSRRVLHFLFSELPLMPLDRRAPRVMAGLRFAVSGAVAVLTVMFLVKSLWWGAILVAPVAGLIWTGCVDLALARDSHRTSSS
jgi:hypothetical protein